MIRSDDIVIVVLERILVSSGCGECFYSFLYLLCLNWRGVSAVVSLNTSFFLFSMPFSVLRSDKASGFVEL